jgi:hypothetical protein
MILFEAEVGSRQFNFAVESSDRDIRRITIPPIEYFLPHRRGLIIGIDDIQTCAKIDNTIFGDVFEEPLPEYCKKILNGHIYAIQSLFLPVDRLISYHENWVNIRESLLGLISKDIISRYISNSYHELSSTRINLVCMKSKKVALAIKNFRFSRVLIENNIQELITSDLLQIRNTEDIGELENYLTAEMSTLKNIQSLLDSKNLIPESYLEIKALVKKIITSEYPSISFN